MTDDQTLAERLKNISIEQLKEGLAARTARAKQAAEEPDDETFELAETTALDLVDSLIAKFAGDEFTAIYTLLIAAADIVRWSGNAKANAENIGGLFNDMLTHLEDAE